MDSGEDKIHDLNKNGQIKRVGTGHFNMITRCYNAVYTL